MSIKNKVLAAAAALTLTSGVGAVGAMTAGVANAATPSCGNSCINFFVQTFSTHHTPAFVMDVYKQGQKVGQPIILFRTSNSDPAEDFTVDNEGLVSEFYALGLVSPEVDLHFGCTPAVEGVCNGPGQVDDYAYEFMYTPYGVQTGLCTGVAATAVNGEHVTLQPCGVSSKTLWVSDSHSGQLTAHAEPLINGSDTNFSDPYGLTYGQSSYPTDTPRPPLYTENVLGFSSGAVNSNQEWSADGGVLP